MGDLNRGRELFTKRVEYPLPKKTGARDYVFYFVPGGDGYRDAGNSFFRKFYPNHVASDVRSLEGLIDALAAEVDRGITHIREIAILSHGNALGLLFPVLNGVTDTNLREYKYLTAFALACLQKDLEGKFPALNNQRKKVIAHLREDSWVTIRACNFGRSQEGMYALYAFFGGKPNVYAPRMYQFFGTPPVYDGMRLDSRLRVHEHLVKQHFLPKDVHTLERKDAIVTAILDRGKFSEPFEIASMRVNDPPPDEVAAYEPFIDQLNARTISAKLKSAFEANGFTLSPKARVSVVSANTQWTITDSFRHEDSTFTIKYDVYESIEFDRNNRQIAALRAGASLVDKPSGRETIAIQLFLSQGENDRFRGKRMLLAAYADGPEPPPAEDKARFGAVFDTLKQGALANGTVDIRAELINQERIELTPQATVTQVSSTGPADTPRITWAIRDKQPFRIQVEHLASQDGYLTHTITVYDDYTSKRDLIWAQYEAIAHIGADPDAPGTELAAYLDRQSFDDLIGLLEYLRSPFKPTHAFYIQHIQEALCRRHGFRTWLVANAPSASDSVLPSDPYTFLSRSEDQDYSALSYNFDFNSVWAEVKASNPPTTIGNDLFAEVDLAKKFKVADQVTGNRTALPELDSDSPAADVEALRALEKVGFEPLFRADKNVAEPIPEPTSLSCAEFKEIVKKWQEVKDLEPDGMRAALELVTTRDGKSYWDVLSSFKTHVKAWFKIVDLTIPGIDWVVMTKKDLVKLVIKKSPFISRTALLAIVAEIEFVFTIPFAMWMDFAEGQVEMRDNWYKFGRLTVIRQWLRELEDLTYRKENDFPSQIDIDVTTPVGTPVYYISRYRWERWKGGRNPNKFIAAPDRLKDGFDDQVQQMDRLGEEIMTIVNECIAELMRDSDLDSCKVEVLREAGIFDISTVKALMVREWASELLAKLPTI